MKMRQVKSHYVVATHKLFKFKEPGQRKNRMNEKENAQMAILSFFYHHYRNIKIAKMILISIGGINAAQHNHNNYKYIFF